MSGNLTEEIAAKAANLPLERQREVLALLDAMNANTQLGTQKKSFKSVQGILQGEYTNLEEDIAAMRREAWRNFPREFPTEENK